MSAHPAPAVSRIASDFLGVATPAENTDGAGCLSEAFEEWRVLLGHENVLCDDNVCNEYSKTTLPNGTRPAGVLRPSSTDEVGQVVEIAARYRVSLHPISRGKNWGYGDACAPTDGQVIVDLSRMNRIREVHVELGYAVIEPGVSQGQMYEYLRERNIPLLADITGAGPDASIVGNILQRGFGHTPYGDRFRHSCGFEVVLPDGSLINTGFGRFENAKASRVFPWGLGPWIDGLFTQSNYGIVTSVCIWLMPMPELVEAFVFQVGEDKLGDAVDAVRRLRMAQTVRSTVHIANDLRVLSSRSRYPWKLAKGTTPLPEPLRRKLRTDNGLNCWNGIGGLYGSRSELRAAKKRIRAEFRGTAKILFFGRRELAIVKAIGRRLNKVRWVRRVSSLAHSCESVLDLLEGIPNAAHISGVDWRDKSKSKSSDVRNSGLIWASPVIPATQEDVRNVLELMSPIFDLFGFDLLITFSSVTERSLCCVTSINYDKLDLADADRAARCYEKLMSELLKAGYAPYRVASVKQLSVDIKCVGSVHSTF